MVLLGPGGGFNAVAPGRGGIASHGDPVDKWPRVDPGKAPKRGEIGAAPDAAEQQPVRTACRKQMQRQFNAPRPARQSNNPVGMQRWRFWQPLRCVYEPDQPTG